MKKSITTIIFLFSFLLILNKDVYASNSKKKAIQAYRNLLNHSTVQWNKDFTISTKDCSFAIAYIDNNNIPELILYNDNILHKLGKGKLYTYKNDKLKLISTVQMDDGKFVYYKKKGIYRSCFILSGEDISWIRFKNGKTKSLFGQRKYVGVNSDTIYYGSDENEITKKKFNYLKKKYIGKRKASKLKFYKVSGGNIKKYMR